MSGRLPSLATLLFASSLTLCQVGGDTPAPGGAASGDPDAARARFESLVREIGVLKEELGRIDQQEWGLLGRLSKLALSSELERREISRIAFERESAASDLEATHRRLAVKSRALASGEAALGRRLREVYQMGQRRDLRLFIGLADPSDLMRGMAYLDFLARREATLVETVRESRTALDQQRRVLDGQTASLRALAVRHEARSRQLGVMRSEVAELVETTRRDQGVHRQAIAEISRAAGALEEAILSGVSQAQGPVSLEITLLKGAIEWPVPGQVIRPFGEIRNVRFGTVTPHPGLDISADPGSQVRAVLAGRVAYARRLTGYGNTVILDHPGHYLSVYARAGRLLVGEGMEVVAGQSIAVAADESLDGGPPTVYFEFRRAGKAEDPLTWLKRKPGRRTEEHR